mmetsp:Transcript_184/g.388  ORF Transcript_184/g.388 Transcript_184/m.388 type:complete len:155 (+) Transcript_184:1296-1760(+)
MWRQALIIRQFLCLCTSRLICTSRSRLLVGIPNTGYYRTDHPQHGFTRGRFIVVNGSHRLCHLLMRMSFQVLCMVDPVRCVSVSDADANAEEESGRPTAETPIKDSRLGSPKEFSRHVSTKSERCLELSNAIAANAVAVRCSVPGNRSNSAHSL